MEKIGFLGVDVSKGMSNFVLVNMNNEELEANFQLDDNAGGHEKLSSLVEGWMKTHRLNQIIAGVESTGGYENNWYQSLKSISGVDVLRINPRWVYHLGKAENRETTTDSVSASIVASYLIYNASKLNFDSWEPTLDISNGRQLNRYIHSIKKEGARWKNMLEKLLYSNMPEILAIKKDKYPNWFLEMLKRYPSKEAILKAGRKGLLKINYLSEKRANEIINALKNSVGLKSTISLELTISGMVEDIQSGKNKLARLQKAQYEIASKTMFKELEILDSLAGIGKDTAATLILEIGNINRFAKASNLVAYWGINPTQKQSGDKYVSRMSKHGNSMVRADLYMAAMNVIIRIPMFKAIYAKQMGKGKKHKQAMVVVMSKLVRVIFGMLKNGVPFDAEMDERNRLKKPVDKDNGEANRKKEERRYQGEAAPAPISSRQRRKRKTVARKVNDKNNEETEASATTTAVKEAPKAILIMQDTGKEEGKDATKYC